MLLVCQPTVGGAAVCVRQLAEAGVRRGLDVTVACPDDGDLPGWVDAAGADRVVLPMTRQPGAADVALARRLRRLLDAAEVVHLHSSKAGALGRLALLATRPGRRPGCVFTPHGWGWHVGGPLAPAYRAFERAAARLADAIVTVSEEEAAEGRGVLGGGARRLVMIPNGVDTEAFTPDGPVAGRGEDPLLVCVGRLVPEKGQDVAVRALALMRATSARLRLVGDGPECSALSTLAQRLGVGGRVELVGSTPDPAPHLRAADVVVIPSRREGMSLVLLEAMACGATVVSTSVSGSSALGGAGLLVPTGDPGALAAAIDDLLADPARRTRLGEAARRRAASQFDLRATTTQNLDLWHRVARNSVRRWPER